MKYKLAQFQQEFEHTLAEVFKKLGGKVPEGRMPEDIYRSFRELVKRLLPGIEFQGITIENEVYRVYFKNRIGVQVEFDQLSSGEKDIIALLFPFIEKEVENELAKTRGEEAPHEDLVILIDAPEAYLHPTLQRGLLDYTHDSIKEAERKGEKLQFFIATHSTTIINEAKPEELYVMVFPDQAPEGNQITKITTDEEKLRLIRDILGDIGYLVAGKPVLILEGRTDVNTLRLLVSNIEKNFTLLPLSGIKEIESFIGNFEKVIPELKSRGFVIHAILDGHHREVEIKSDVIHIWPVVCIENLLLFDDGAIYEALKTLLGPADMENRGIRSKEDVKRLICEIVKDRSFKEKECEKRLSRDLYGKYYLELPLTEDTKQKVQSFLEQRVERARRRLEETQQELERVTQDLDKARREFDGKLILGELARRFSLKREELSYLIASKLNELNRVPSEVINLLNGIRKSLK